MSFSDEVAAEYIPRPSREEQMIQAWAAEWFERVGITDPPEVQLSYPKVLNTVSADAGREVYRDGVQASWEYDGYRYEISPIGEGEFPNPTCFVSIYTRHGMKPANNRAQIGKAITEDRA